MAALSKFVLLLAIFLSAGYANAFLSLNQVAVNQVRVNYLIRFKGANKPKSINLNGQTTNQRLEWDAELPNFFSPKQVNGVNHDHDKIKVDKRVMFSDEWDSEILSESPVEYNP